MLTNTKDRIYPDLQLPQSYLSNMIFKTGNTIALLLIRHCIRYCIACYKAVTLTRWFVELYKLKRPD